MKLHKPIVQAVSEGLEEIFEENKLADRVVRGQIKKDRRWGSRDRRFIAECIYDCVRWWKWYLAIGEIDEQDPDRFEKVLAIYLQEKKVDFPEWFTPNIPDFVSIQKNKTKYAADLSCSASIPDWLNELGHRELGDRWEKEINALNQTTDVVLRVNTLKTDKTKLKTILAKEGLEVEEIPDFQDALRLKQRRDLSQLKSFKKGYYEIQDASSQLVAPFSKVSEGMTVIDACAGAGGKSLHMAAQMENKGKIFSLDIEDAKLIELEKRSKRAGTRIVSAHLIYQQQVKKLAEKANVLLIDAPCSGLGILRRKPDAKWKLSLDKIDEYKTKQEQILEEYQEMVMPGGALVYVTCSILPSENEKQIENFLAKQNGRYSLEAEKKVWPSEGFDGFYMARLRKL
ncbi:MAG: RsmB/NOP family class I SAM-dependent RNA methyltransferase [Bacteroidales bacterium]|nr:RsmB/NOP family class I SAM-dependent RNA methyltransferase [Bacteroidales bacterium]